MRVSFKEWPVITQKSLLQMEDTIGPSKKVGTVAASPCPAAQGSTLLSTHQHHQGFTPSCPKITSSIPLPSLRASFLWPDRTLYPESSLLIVPLMPCLTWILSGGRGELPCSSQGRAAHTQSVKAVFWGGGPSFLLPLSKPIFLHII